MTSSIGSLFSHRQVSYAVNPLPRVQNRAGTPWILPGNITSCLQGVRNGVAAIGTGQRSRGIDVHKDSIASAAEKLPVTALNRKALDKLFTIAVNVRTDTVQADLRRAQNELGKRLVLLGMRKEESNLSQALTAIEMSLSTVRNHPGDTPKMIFNHVTEPNVHLVSLPRALLQERDGVQPSVAHPGRPTGSDRPSVFGKLSGLSNLLGSCWSRSRGSRIDVERDTLSQAIARKSGHLNGVSMKTYHKLSQIVQSEVKQAGGDSARLDALAGEIRQGMADCNDPAIFTGGTALASCRIHRALQRAERDVALQPRA